MKILLTNDWHFSRKNPGSRIDNYNAELFASLEQIRKLVEALKIEAVLIAGDIFHDKGNALWAVVADLLDWGRALRRLGCDVVSIPGNHDQTHDRFDSMGETPYGVLVSSGVFTDVSRTPYALGGHGPVVYGIPWPDGYDPEQFAHIPPTTDIVMVHGFATAEGGEKFGVHCHQYSVLAKTAPAVQLWHFGHDHTDHGVWKTLNRAQFVNIGALARGALDTDTLVREVKVALADVTPKGSSPLRVQCIALKVPPVEEIFDLRQYEKKALERVELERFLNELSDGLAGVLDVDYRTILQGMPLDAAVRAKVEQYITRAEQMHAG